MVRFVLLGILIGIFTFALLGIIEAMRLLAVGLMALCLLALLG